MIGEKAYVDRGSEAESVGETAGRAGDGWRGKGVRDEGVIGRETYRQMRVRKGQRLIPMMEMECGKNWWGS